MRRAFPILFAAVTAAALSAGPVLGAAAPEAADGPKAGAKPDAHGHSHGEPSKGGLSFLQLERYDLGIYTLVVFGLLVLILQKTAWPKIQEGLDKREASIQGARDEAQKLKAEAEAIRAQLNGEMASAQDKIRALLDEARRDADALRTTEREAGVKEAAAERERARREIEAAKDAALADITEKAVELASLLSSKAIRRQLTIDDHRRLLDESLAELSTAAVRS